MQCTGVIAYPVETIVFTPLNSRFPLVMTVKRGYVAFSLN